MDATVFNEKLSQLYHLLCEMQKIAPNEQLTEPWEDVFAGINDTKTYLDAVKGNNELPTVYNVEIIFEAEGSREDLYQLYDNLEQYPEFIRDDSKEQCSYDVSTKNLQIKFFGIWLGDIEDCIKLTHHAEGLYENTDFQFIHVEVCVDGKWHGRVQLNQSQESEYER